MSTDLVRYSVVDEIAEMRALDADFRRSVENAAEGFVVVASTEDCQEGLNAFVEKRTPNYKAR